MSQIEVVPCQARITVTATGPVVHLCPHVDETDEGEVVITWVTAGSTIELHSLAAHLRTYASQRISHEDLARRLVDDLTLPGIEGVYVAARFTTAGLGVEVKSAVPGDALVQAGT